MMRCVLLSFVLCFTAGVTRAEVDFDQIPYSMGIPETQPDRHLEQGRYRRRQLEQVAMKQPCKVPGFTTFGTCIYFRDTATRALVIHYAISGELVAVDDGGLVILSGLPL